jgi:hypothetical protein
MFSASNCDGKISISVTDCKRLNLCASLQLACLVSPEPLTTKRLTLDENKDVEQGRTKALP